MGKSLFIAEKPSVAQELAKALKINTKKLTDIWKENPQSLPGA